MSNNDRSEPANHAVGSQVDQPVGRPEPERAKPLHALCPDPPIGRRCAQCGGELYCRKPACPYADLCDAHGECTNGCALLKAYKMRPWKE